MLSPRTSATAARSGGRHGLRGWREGRRPLGRHRGRAHRSAVDGDDARGRLLLHEGCPCDRRLPARTGWPARPRRARRALLAGLRRQREGGDPVRWLFSHRAGLSSLDRGLSRTEALSWDPVIEAIEAQVPLWLPGSAWAYHTITYGWLVGEVIRRVSGSGSGCSSNVASPSRSTSGSGWACLVRSATTSRGSWSRLPDADVELASVIRAGGHHAAACPRGRRLRLRVPVGRRPCHLQRPGHPGGRGAGSQRHR